MQIQNAILTGSTTVYGPITFVSGSLTGTASLATNASTASFVLPLSQSLFVTGGINLTGSLTVSGSITTTGAITAQTLVVQTITSSILYSSGSNIFGNQLTNTQTFTGSIQASGSSSHFLIGGSVGIGTTSPTSALQIFRTAYTGNQFKTYAELQAAPTTLTYSTSDGFGLILNMYEAVSGNPYTRYADIVANTGDVSDSAMRFFTKAYSTNTAERMRITPAGNVGIGLTNPSAVLHISGSGSGSLMQISSHVSSSIFFVSGSGNVGIGTTTPNNLTDIVGSTAGDGGAFNGTGAILRVKQNATWTANQPWALYVEGYSYLNGFRINAADGIRALYKTAAGGTLGFATAGNDPITFTQTDSIERMRIAAGGNIGIGLTNPSAVLHVSGSGSGSLMQISSHVSSSIFYVSGSGNIGIGTASPSTPLEIYSATGNQLKISTNDATSANNSGIFFYNEASATSSTRRSYILLDPNGANGSGGDYSYFDMYGSGTVRVMNQLTSGVLALGVGGTNIINITGSRVGIGTTTPSTKLEVVGTDENILKIKNTGGQPALVRFNDTSTTGDPYIGSYGNSLAFGIYGVGESMRIDSSRNVGIGTTTPTATLEASGSIVSTTGQFGSTKSLVVISALNTYYQIYPGAPSGIFTARDNTNGGSGIWVMDPNGGGTLVSSNWINGTYSIVYNGNWQIQKTAGNVPVNMHCCLYGN